MSEKYELSVVIPLLNEQESVKPLYSSLKESLKELNRTYEIIFVDDGSIDDSFKILELLHSQDSNVKIIQFRKNFGKSAALWCGFQHAEGEIIITMDSDLQDDPKEISKLISKIEQGDDLVSGWRIKRADSISKKLFSRIFNQITALLTGMRIHDFNCGLKAYKKDVARELMIYGELHRFIPVLAYWKGYQVTEVQVAHHSREYGKSKYGIERLWKGFWDFITILFLTKYANSPLYLFGLIGLVLGLAGLGINIYLATIWFMGQYIGHRPLLILAVLLVILGGQFISMGLLGEMIISKYKSKEQYSIRKVLGK
jgi:glycosyltransferase involved in cell wall biosynthesis